MQQYLFLSKKSVFLLFSTFFLFHSCKNDDPFNDPTKTNQTVNKWIHENMDLYYYWRTDLPAFNKSNAFPEEYFNTLINNDDRFSAIYDDYVSISNQLKGVSASEVGFKFQLYLESPSSDNVIAVVLYTKKGTDAFTKGIKRGDIIRKINGQQLTKTNYSQVIANLSNETPSVKLTFANKIDGVYVDKPEVEITKSKQFAENPLYLDTIYTTPSKKIGYFVYHFFTNDAGDQSMSYDLKLNAAMAKFASENVTELIVDFRYNSGGAISSAVHLSSMLVPNLTNNKLFSYTKYNQNFIDYFNSAEYKRKYNDNPMETKFATTISVASPKPVTVPLNNIGNKLQRIFFITSNRTASASEMVINGLKPFVTCVLIGDTTVGKNVGSILINDTENVSNKWAIMPIVLRYYNANNESNFTYGFAPDVVMADDTNYELGDVREGMLAKALAIITGKQTVKSVNVSQPIFGQPLKVNLPSQLSTLIIDKESVRSIFESKN